MKDDVKMRKRGSQWKSQPKSKGKVPTGFVTVNSEAPLSGRSYDFIKFQQVVMPISTEKKVSGTYQSWLHNTLVDACFLEREQTV